MTNKIQDAQYKTAYKKAFSTAQQAVTSAKAQDLFTESTGSGDTVNEKANFHAFMSQFKTVKQCLSENNRECWDINGERYGLAYGDGFPASDQTTHAFIDSSGVAWTMYYHNSFVLTFFDSNGFKKPNQWGKDRFAILIQDENNNLKGIPSKVVPFYEGANSNVCIENKCGTIGDPDYGTYYGTSWLYK